VWQIVEMMNFLYCFGMILEIGAFASLRFYQPDLPRPYRFACLTNPKSSPPWHSSHRHAWASRLTLIGVQAEADGPPG